VVNYDKASWDVQPNDVKKDYGNYREVTVAWSGIILDVETLKKHDCYEVILLVKHYYYDWIEDFGPQTEIIFLSTRAEGKFKTKWSIKKGADISRYRDDVGKMVCS
jgi:hypothetical protein